MTVASEEKQLWLDHRTGRDQSAHQQLFFRYVPWSRAVAREVYRRIRIPQMDWNDYAQNATIGLLEAMSRYDENRGIDFMAYAKPRVRGAVFNGLRTFLSDAPHRDVAAERLYERLETFNISSEGDSLDNMISAVSGLGLGLLIESSFSINSIKGDSDASLLVEKHQMDRLLAGVVERLPEREKMVLRLHYQQFLPFVEIASLLGLTKGRVSQIHKSAIEKCRAMLEVKTIDGIKA
jgi:RNA polymerase sigma factor for flagellar operon FliA